MVFDYGISILQMMENDAKALALMVKRMLDNSVFGRTIVVCAGKGNNGAGGLGAARHLKNWGAYVKVILTHLENELGDITRQQLKPIKQMDIKIFKPDMVGVDILVELKSADLVLDALLGYGIEGDPHEETAGLIADINRSHVPILSNDLPSGLDPDTGVAHNPTVKAAATLTLALPKKGFLNHAAKEYIGKLYLADISIPHGLYKYLKIEVPKDLFAKDFIVEL